jgi:hypothetical protein
VWHHCVYKFLFLISILGKLQYNPTHSFHAILIIEKQPSYPLACNDHQNSIPIKLKKRATQTEGIKKTGFAEDVLVTLLIGT